MSELHPSCRTPEYEAIVARLEERKAKRKGLTAERLGELLHYDPASGLFTRLVTRGGNSLAGSVAGCVHPHGYNSISIDGVAYNASQLAWLYVKGCWPKHTIAHRDLNRLNNSWDNIRPATRSRKDEEERLTQIIRDSDIVHGVAQIAKVLRLKPGQTYYLLNRGRIPGAVKLGSGWTASKRELLKPFLAGLAGSSRLKLPRSLDELAA